MGGGLGGVWGEACEVLGRRILQKCPIFAEMSRPILRNTAQAVYGPKSVVNGRKIYSYIDIPKTVLVLCSENYFQFSGSNSVLSNLMNYVIFVTGWNW